MNDTEWSPKVEPEYIRLVMEQHEAMSALSAKQAAARVQLALRLRRKHTTD